MGQSKKGMVTRNMKKIRLVLCMMACLFGLTACTPEKPVEDNTKQELLQKTSIIIDYALNAIPVDQVDLFVAQGAEFMEEQFESSLGCKVNGNGMVTAFTSWKRGIEEIGDYAGTTGYSVKYNTKGDQVIVIAYVSGSTGRTAQAEFVYDDDLHHTLESVALNVDYTMGEKMSKAGLNTLIGMGTVFIVLIFLAFIISLFGIINKVQTASENKKKNQTAAAPDKVVAQIIEKEEQADDDELIAVISAAIAAYESANGQSSDGYVVRSIRKVSSSKR